MKRAVVVHREPCPRCFERSLLGGRPECCAGVGRERAQPDREELARRHYWIAEMMAKERLPVDWHHVAVRMAQALAGLPEGDLP